MMNYQKILVENIHSTAIATVDAEGKPVNRIIDMMLEKDGKLYFLTAKGKAFYDQLMAQAYVSIAGVKNQASISLHGNIRNIGKQYLDEIFEKNPYMKQIYPDDRREPLEVFEIYEGEGEYFDISVTPIVRESFTIGEVKASNHGYIIHDTCIGCGKCIDVCPQNCIEEGVPYRIIERHCVHCGACMQVCPQHAIEKSNV